MCPLSLLLQRFLTQVNFKSEEVKGYEVGVAVRAFLLFYDGSSWPNTWKHVHMCDRY